MTDQTIGLVVDEGVPVRVADTLVKELPEWEVSVVNEQIPLDEDGGIPMVDLARHYRSDQGFDVVVMITELPLRVGTTPLAPTTTSKSEWHCSHCLHSVSFECRNGSATWLYR